MTLVKFNKSETLPNFIDRFFQGDPFPGTDFFQASHLPQMKLPAVNILEKADSFLVELAVPGRKKEDFKIELNDQLLTISSETSTEKEEKDKDGKFTRREFGFQTFSRSFTLPQSIDAQRIEARYEDGVLRLELAKKEEAKEKGPRLIDIS